jgi:polar amino acid transport system substrate-binding protein
MRTLWLTVSVVCAVALTSPVLAQSGNGDEPAAPPAAAPEAMSKGTVAAIRQRGTLRVCVTPRAPWVTVGEDGDFEGYSVALVDLMAKDLEVKVDFIQTRAPELLASLEQGQCDVVPGLSPTPQRALVAHFSQPTAVYDIDLVAHHDVADDLEERKDVDNPKVILGVLADSPEMADVRRLFPRATVRVFENPRDLEAALRRGKVHATLVPRPQARLLVRSTRDDHLVTPLDKPVARRGEGFAVRLGDVEFLAYLNNWIQIRTEDGFLEEQAVHWFGTKRHRD